MSVLSSYFNYSVHQNSQDFDDYLLKETVGKDGAVSMVPTKVDYKKIMLSNGDSSVWSYTNLMKAGINPRSLGVRTSDPTRSEGYDRLDVMLSEMDNKEVK